MNKFQSINSRVIPLPINDVDTDQIIPAQFLTSVSKEGYAENLFRRLRDKDESFPLNDPIYKDAKVLVAGHNFGCGSSREHAVWALTGYGLKVVVAESFADIFYNNSAKNGLLLVTLPKEVVNKIQNASLADESFRVSVDLQSQTVTTSSGEIYSFEYDQFRKHCLLNGLDDIDYILSYNEKLDQYRCRNEKSWMKPIRASEIVKVPQPV